MKKIILTTLAIMTVISLNGQWYYRQYGVQSLENMNRDQLNDALHRCEAASGIGLLLTIGGVAMTVGGVYFINKGSDMESDRFLGNFNSMMGGMGLVTLGILATIPGMVIIVNNGSREKQIKLSLTKFEGRAPVPGVTVTFTF